MVDSMESCKWDLGSKRVISEKQLVLLVCTFRVIFIFLWWILVPPLCSLLIILQGWSLKHSHQTDPMSSTNSLTDWTALDWLSLFAWFKKKSLMLWKSCKVTYMLLVDQIWSWTQSREVHDQCSNVKIILNKVSFLSLIQEHPFYKLVPMKVW